MSFTPGNIIQYSENYPFLPIAIRMQTANSWTRENTTGNNFLGNGGTELNTTSNLYDLAYRNYDPILGRMNQIDPMATKYASLTPYNFSFNDPVTFTDPSGADPEYGITRYTYDDRVDHYRGQFYSGGSTSALRFHTGGRSGGITNWSYAPSFGQLVQMRNDALRLSLSVLAFVQKYRLEVWEQGRNYSDNEGSVEFHHQYYFLKSISQQQQTGNGPGWFDDPQGEFFFDHWRNGKGQELNLNSAEWSRYMRSNDYLANVSIASHLYSLGIKNSGRISGSFAGKTGKDDWRSGYGMLNGSNARVGGLQYAGYAHVNSNGSISYLLNFTWNDIMDPKLSELGDRVGSALFPGTPYTVHISWTDLITITPK